MSSRRSRESRLHRLGPTGDQGLCWRHLWIIKDEYCVCMHQMLKWIGLRIGQSLGGGRATGKSWRASLQGIDTPLGKEIIHEKWVWHECRTQLQCGELQKSICSLVEPWISMRDGPLCSTFYTPSSHILLVPVAFFHPAPCPLSIQLTYA